MRPAHIADANPRSVRRALAVGFAVSLVVALWIWLAAGSDDWSTSYSFRGQQSDYLNLLVDGILKGHLSLDVEVTYAPLSVAGQAPSPIPWMLDASFYEGRYYLYFGVVPVVLLMLPYSALTGHDLATNVVVLIWMVIGYGAALAAYRRLRTKHFPELSVAWDVLLVVVLGLGAIQPFLAVRGEFYEVVISAAYAMAMLGVWGIANIFTGTRRPLLHLAFSSLVMGLAVGCRPTGLLALPALLVPAWHLWRTRDRFPKLNLISLSVATLVPAGLVGLGLAAYNYARFGNITDFGFAYSLNSFTASGDPAASLRFIGSNLKWYFLSFPSFSPYFPFVFPVSGSFRPSQYHGIEAVHGQIWLTLGLITTLVGFMTSSVARQGLRPLRAWLSTIGLQAFPPLVLLITLGFRSNRYLADFQPTFLLGLLVVIGLLLTRKAPQAVRFVRPTVALSLVGGCVLALFSALQQYDHFRDSRPATYKKLERWGNWPSYWAAELGLLKYGPVKFEAKFPEVESAQMQPLLTIGLPEYTDTLLVALHPGNLFQLKSDHHLYSGEEDIVRANDPAKTHVIEVDMGAFYPPANHPYFDGYNRTEVYVLKNRVKVKLDGETVIDGPMGSYDAPPWTLQLGKNDATYQGFPKSFSGEVGSMTRPEFSLTEALQPAVSERGIWCVELELPTTLDEFVPVLAAGSQGKGNLLVLKRIDNETIRFALDTWGVSLEQSGPIKVSDESRHRLDIFTSHTVADSGNNDESSPEPNGSPPHELFVWLDGTLVWETHVPAYIEAFRSVHLGKNPQGFTTGAHSYPGYFRVLVLSEMDIQDLLQLNRAEMAPASP